MKFKNFWDRMFNRTVQTVHETGKENWSRRSADGKTFDYVRSFVIYKVVDKFNGNETLKKVYFT